MRKQIFTTLLLFAATLVAAQSAHPEWKPANPQPGTTVQVSCAVSKESTTPSTLYILEFVEKKPVATAIPLQPVNGKLIARFNTSKNARSVLMAVKTGEKWDNNNGEGYFIQFKTAAGQPVPGALAAEATLYRDYGTVMDLDRNVNLAYEKFQTAFQQDPKLRTEFLESYVRVLMAVLRGDEGKTAAEKVMSETEEQPQLPETTLRFITKTYERLGFNDKGAATRQKMQTLFPNGWATRDLRRKAINEQADATTKIQLLETFRKDFPTLDEDEQNEMNRIWSGVMRNLGNNNRWEDLAHCAALVPPGIAASVYNSFGWNLAEKGTDLVRAEAMAQQAFEWATADLNTPCPPHTFPDEWSKNLVYAQATYADTYAYTLEKNNKNKEALAFQKIAVEGTDRQSAEINERYTTLLQSVDAPELSAELESFILANAATAAMKDQYKNSLLKKMTETQAADKLSVIEKQAATNKKQELLRNMLQKKATPFVLKDLQGKEVSLESLQGKIVVVDFWATWCGPCKASFPGMQKTVDKYKNDPKVAFLFVDTWENGGEKEKNAEKFITEKGYTFQVLMDNDNKVVGNFGVSGIPTKFVIDQNGLVRFKSVGFAGSDDALVAELSEMIGILQGLAR